MHVLIDLLQELYLYGLSLDSCPRETPLQEEIFQCLALIDPYLENQLFKRTSSMKRLLTDYPTRSTRFKAS